jgi:hypothetical protein
MAVKRSIEVIISDAGVAYHHADGEIESVDWVDLQKVFIKTTDDGPYFPDVYWILVGNHGGCMIPQGVEGEEALAERLQALPGFSHSALIDSMSSVDNQLFLCWNRQE